MAKTIGGGKFCMLTAMAEEDKKKKAALSAHKANFNRTTGGGHSVIA